MPNLDQTGPLGQGPMTGRRMGRCTNYGAYKQNTNFNNDRNENQLDDFQTQNYLKGYGRGLGLRRGLGFVLVAIKVVEDVEWDAKIVLEVIIN